MFFFCSEKLRILYSKKYLTLNLVAILMMEVFSSIIITVVPAYIHVALSVGFIAHFASIIRKKNPTVDEFNSNYVISILLVMANVVSAVFTVDVECYLTIPFIVGIVLGNMNFIFKSRLLSYLILPFMATPLLKIILGGFEIHLIALFACLSFMCITSAVLVSSNKASIEREGERKAEFVKEVFKLTSGLSHHDIRNELSKMMILSSKKHRSDLNLFLETFDHHVQNIVSHVNLSVFETGPLSISDLISRLNHITRHCSNFTFDAEDEILVNGNYNIVYSLLKNIFENAIEAARRNNICLELSVGKYDNVIEVIDNCGGFDVNMIAMGCSSKSGNGHGVFLKTVVDPSFQKMFGFEVSLYRMTDGTRTVIKFNNEVQHG